MPAYQGTYYEKSFTIKDRSTGTAINITDWEFEAHVKDNRNDDDALVTLTSANGGFQLIDGANGRVKLVMTEEQTALLPVGKMVFDVVRTAPEPAPLWLFGGSFKVKRPVTIPEES